MNGMTITYVDNRNGHIYKNYYVDAASVSKKTYSGGCGEETFVLLLDKQLRILTGKPLDDVISIESGNSLPSNLERG